MSGRRTGSDGRGREKRTLERLLEDAISPAPAQRRSGLRCGAVADVQLVCGAGRYEVDVLMRVSEASEDLAVVGQITRADSIHEPVRALTLVAFECEALQPVATVSTDEFGGFEMTLDQSGRYALALGESTSAPCIYLWEGMSR